MFKPVASHAASGALASAPVPPREPVLRRIPPWLAWGGVALGVLLAWWGQGWGVAAAAAAVWLTRQRVHAQVVAEAPAPVDQSRSDAADEALTDLPSGGRVGAETMVTRVVPVWRRQLEVTRQASNDGVGQLMATFTDMNEALHTLTQHLQGATLGVAPGAIDQAVAQEAQALGQLKAASTRAFAQRDEAVNELVRCSGELAALQQLAKQARELGRHTRLVAFNASIESSRTQEGHTAGAQAVAVEVRMLAARMAEIGEKIEQAVRTLNETVQRAQRIGQVSDTSAPELTMEIDLQARQALRALLSAMGASLQGSLEVQQASARLAQQLDEVFAQFQFGDRVSQMLSIVAQNMDELACWIVAHPKATQTDAAQWLAALEASYTMEEQRSHHHGNVHVELASAVEYF